MESRTIDPQRQQAHRIFLLSVAAAIITETYRFSRQSVSQWNRLKLL